MQKSSHNKKVGGVETGYSQDPHTQVGSPTSGEIITIAGEQGLEIHLRLHSMEMVHQNDKSPEQLAKDSGLLKGTHRISTCSKSQCGGSNLKRALADLGEPLIEASC